MIRRAVRLALLVVGVVLVVPGGVVGVRTALYKSRQVAPEPPASFSVDVEAASRRLARALTFRTVSLPGQPPGAAELDGLHRFLAESYPKVHAAMQREAVSPHATLLTWPGREAQLPPVVLLAHLDVVPVEPGTEDKWTHPPWDGVIEGGYVWGRGAIDDKGSALALLEACELLLGKGFQPRRTVLIALGADEEIGGRRGAVELAKRLGERGVKPLFVLDEGLTITQGLLTMVPQPVALVGIAEKGYLSIELSAREDGGHSSMPPRQTNVGIVAGAVTRLEDHPLPPSLDGPVREMLDHVGPEASLGPRMALANLWLTGPLMSRGLSAAPSGNALIRTTTAATMFEGSVKDNVLPARARAVVNFRIRPGDTIESVTEYVRTAVADPRVEVKALQETLSNPSRIASTSSPGWTLIERTIRQRFPDAVVAPGLVVGATDSRHYAGLGADTYRFAPFPLRKEDLPRIHGRDERLAVSDFGNGIGFYAQLLSNLDGVQ